MACPQCTGSLLRIPRGWADRMLSAIIPVRRYRCRSEDCKWEGNLAKRRVLTPRRADGGPFYWRLD